MALLDETRADEVDYHRWSGLEDPIETLTLVFDVHIGKKYGIVKREVPNLEIPRNQPARVGDITEHLESHLLLPGGHGKRLLLQAVCDKTLLRVNDDGRNETVGIVPLVCNQIWSSILRDYSAPCVKVVVDQYRFFGSHRTSCVARILNRELKFVDMTTFLPTKNLKPDNVMELCRCIFERDTKVKQELRKGVWMHLVGVYHPSLKSRRDREDYVERLRRVYDSLKGKWQVKQRDNNPQLSHILEATQRDAVRTDPNHPFYATEMRTGANVEITEGDNIQKLVNIITIYTLEHEGLSYTQGMTDLLSPILYVMNREADAYICFAAMVERIKDHFGHWCEGTLNKLERLRHLCEVLDPQLFHYLTNTIEEDAFALFFGMVLIECRREFSFEDSFHLLEAVWAGVACMKDKIPHSTDLSYSEWAHFMTYNSKDDLQQVFGEIECAYSAEPLRQNTISDGYSIEYRPGFSRNASLVSQSSTMGDSYERPRPYSAPQQPIISEPSPAISINPSDGSASGTVPYTHSNTHGVTDVVIEPCNELNPPLTESRPRSYTDPSSLMSSQSDGQITNGHDVSEHESGNTSNVAYSHSESELYDSFSQNNKVPAKKYTKQSFKHPTEMSDMSSISSSNGNSQLLESTDNGQASRSRSPLSEVTPLEKTQTVKNGATVETEVEVHQYNTVSDSTSPEPDFKTPTQPENDHQSHSEGETPVAIQNHLTGPVQSESSVYQSAPSTTTSTQDMLANGHIVTEQTRSPIQTSSSSTGPSQSESSGAYQTAHSSSASSRELLMNGHIPTVKDEKVKKKKSSSKSRVVQHGGRLTIEHIAENSLSNEQLHSSVADYSPQRTHRKGSIPIDVNRTSPYDEDLVSAGSSRVTPVAFFDTMEQLASSAPSSSANFGHLQEPSVKSEDDDDENEGYVAGHRLRHHSRANSEISLLISQLVSTEQAAPRVSREKSLTVPVSDCFPLFVCLAILVQNRHAIMRRTTDFVGLSVLLNAQAGTQNIDSTLHVAKCLYKTYRKYQLGYFGPENLDNWLDSDVVVKQRRETTSAPASARLERRSRTSQASDSVFVNSS